MAYQAIARRWRPHRFEDLVGQSHVVQTLKNAIESGRVSHAYLFSGARGVGKTSVARIFAKALRCPNAEQATPCNTCSECIAIAESRSVDVAEIDGASHNGVEAVRGVRDNVVYSAATGFYKIYIIDEAHMLSLSAFNALLKTLEEPPAHVIFVLATTEPQKIPVTILSRCQRFEFRRLSQPQIVQRLEEILTAEQVTLSPEALRLLAAHADGSLRDSLSLLDQVLSHGRGDLEIGQEQVVKALGISPSNSVTDFWAAVVDQNIPALLSLLHEAHAAGVDLKHFGERCLEELRLLYLITLAAESEMPVDAQGLDIASMHFEQLKALSARTSRVTLERAAQILNHTVNQMGWASLPRFVLEMAAVRIAHLSPLAELERALQGESAIHSGENAQQRQLGAPAKAIPPARPPAPTRPERPAESAAPNRVEPAPAPENAMARPEPPLPEDPSPPPARRPEPPSHGAAPAQNWQGFIDSVMKKRPLLGALLCHGEFRREGKTILLAFPHGSFYERQAGDAKNRADTEEHLKAFFGPDISFSLASAQGESVRSLEKSREEQTARIKQQALEHPSVLQAQEALGAQVVDVSVES